jgi:hypothetical protein
MEKRCFKCGETKPLDAFYRHPMMADGHLNKCAECAKKDVRQHRIKHPEKHREYDRERARCAERIAANTNRTRAYRAANPERRAAHNAVNNAVRDGRLHKLPCAFCGSEDRLEAHHHDYSKPLDVTWLCSGCHSRFHALERMAAYEREEAA